MKCYVCDKEVSIYHYCDESEPLANGDSPAWCTECFEQTPCGKGEHGEGCPTYVFEGG